MPIHIGKMQQFNASTNKQINNSTITNMPLIQLTNFKTITDFINHMKEADADQLTASFVDEKMTDIFLNRLKYYLIFNPYTNFTSTIPMEVEQQLNRFIEVARSDYDGSMQMPFKWTDFYQKEHSFFSELNEAKDNLFLMQLRDDYLAWLQAQEERFHKIDLLALGYVFDTYNFNTVLQDLPKSKLLPIGDLNRQMTRLWGDLDNQYEVHLKSFYAIENPKYKDKEDIPKFMWDEFCAPSALNAFPKAQRTFQKTVFGWLEGQMTARRIKLRWEEIPKSYQLVITLMKDLQIQMDNPKTNEKKAANLPEKRIKKESMEDYPKHIFLNAKAYQLFITFVENAILINQVAFVYRYMSEIENPPLILVKDTPFRKWYNAQEQFPLKLDNTTATYVNTKNEDRIMAYKIAKKIHDKNQ